MAVRAQDPDINNYGGKDETAGASASSSDNTVWMSKDVQSYTIDGAQSVYPGSYGLQDYFNNPQTSAFAPGHYTTKSYAASQMNNLPMGDRLLLMSINVANGGRKTAGPAWEMFVQQSSALGTSGVKKSPMELAREYAMANGITIDGVLSGDGSGDGSGSGSYNGPVTRTSVAHADAASVRELADTVGLEMLGRAVTEDEWKRIANRVTKYENRNPDVTTTTPNGPAASSSVSQAGASAQGRQDVIESILAKNPQYGDYQKATTLMSWLNAAISERPSV